MTAGSNDFFAIYAAEVVRHVDTVVSAYDRKWQNAVVLSKASIHHLLASISLRATTGLDRHATQAKECGDADDGKNMWHYSGMSTTS